MKIFEKQLWHLLSLAVLVAAMYYLVDFGIISMSGSFWGVSCTTWFICAIGIAVTHHLYVLINWRLELHYKWLTRTLGSIAFRLYTIGFFIIFVLRMVFIIHVAIANYNTLQLNPIISYSLAGIVLLLAGYAIYSVIRYFGMDRAAGIDHFDPEAKNRPFVKKGIFKYTSNGMYTYALMMFYLPGLIALSEAALMAGVFSHIFIWAHYYFTELPDIKRIYDTNPKKAL